MAMQDIDWWDKGVTWLAAIVAALFAWLGRTVHGHVKRVDSLEQTVARMENNHIERREMITSVASRLESHIDETRKGFTETREHIDVVTSDIKSDIRTLTAAVLDRK